MPTVAQKLCHDIVEPVLKQSSTDASKGKSTRKFGNSSSIGTSNAKPMRFVHIDRKTNSQIKTSHTDGMTIIKSKTSILKSLAETAVNTLASGPLKCDNNCVTLVRKRDQQKSCKCGQKRPSSRASTKSIQTLNKKDFSLTDKACTHCVETVTCGTQLLDKTNSLLSGSKKMKSNISMKSGSNISLKLPGSVQDSLKLRINSGSSKCSNVTRQSFRHQLDNSMIYKTPTMKYVSAKRWALSNYPTRGPDF